MFKYNINYLSSWVHCFNEKHEALESFVSNPLKWGCWHYSVRQVVCLGYNKIRSTLYWRMKGYCLGHLTAWFMTWSSPRWQATTQTWVKTKMDQRKYISRYETKSLTSMSYANLHKNQLNRVTVGCQERSDKRNYWWPKFGLANLLSVGIGFESNHND